jgi:hypothetical protein
MSVWDSWNHSCFHRSEQKLIENLKYIVFSGLIVLPIVLVLLPASFFDQGQSLCLSVLLLDQQCYGCGITRAVQHFIHFDFQAAWNYNKLVVIVAPILFFVWLKWLRDAWVRITNKVK